MITDKELRDLNRNLDSKFQYIGQYASRDELNRSSGSVTEYKWRYMSFRVNEPLIVCLRILQDKDLLDCSIDRLHRRIQYYRSEDIFDVSYRFKYNTPYDEDLVIMTLNKIIAAFHILELKELHENTANYIIRLSR